MSDKVKSNPATNTVTKEASHYEVEIHKSLIHPNIVRFINSFQQASFVFIIMEWCKGGSLLDLLNSRLNAPLKEIEIVSIMTDTCQALLHLHRRSLIHRDIKIENVLVSFENAKTVYKLCDFGSVTKSIIPYGTILPKDQLLLFKHELDKTTTPQYRAPEIIDLSLGLGIDFKIDIWALGVLLYKLCYFTTPFENSGVASIMNARYTIPNNPPQTKLILYLIEIMLQVDPRSRPTCDIVLDQLQQHQYNPSLNNPTMNSSINNPLMNSSPQYNTINSSPQYNPINSSPQYNPPIINQQYNSSPINPLLTSQQYNPSINSPSPVITPLMNRQFNPSHISLLNSSPIPSLNQPLLSNNNSNIQSYQQLNPNTINSPSFQMNNPNQMTNNNQVINPNQMTNLNQMNNPNQMNSTQISNPITLRENNYPYSIQSIQPIQTIPITTNNYSNNYNLNHSNLGSNQINYPIYNNMNQIDNNTSQYNQSNSINQYSQNISMNSSPLSQYNQNSSNTTVNPSPLNNSNTSMNPTSVNNSVNQYNQMPMNLPSLFVPNTIPQQQYIQQPLNQQQPSNQQQYIQQPLNQQPFNQQQYNQQQYNQQYNQYNQQPINPSSQRTVDFVSIPSKKPTQTINTSLFDPLNK